MLRTKGTFLSAMDLAYGFSKEMELLQAKDQGADMMVERNELSQVMQLE